MATKYSITDNDVDTGQNYVQKAFIIDVYPNMVRHLKTAGLWLWGMNDYGQLGNGTFSVATRESSPVQTVAGGTNWKQISCGNRHSGAIKVDGTLWMWGDNTFGQLGDGTVASKSSPVQVVGGGNVWGSISCGSSHTVAVKTDGTLWAWGDNTFGQLGDGTVASKSSPVQTVAGGNTWKQVASSCGSMHTVAIKSDGTLWAWGANASGQLGDSTTVSKSSPVQTVAGGNNWKQASCGQYFTIATKNDNTLWLWGDNAAGQLGDSTTVSKSSPVQTVAGGTNWRQHSGDWYHTAAIKADGTLWIWGWNGSGRLGINDGNTNLYLSSPVQTISGGTTWKSVSCGYATTAAIKTDGTLWAWGKDQVGLINSAFISNHSSPVQTVAGGTNWKQVALGKSFLAGIREEEDW